MTDLPDYATIDAPPEKDPEAYNHHERRGEIFDLIVNRGDPSAIRQVRLAERYDVAESTISNDMDRLRESVSTHLGTSAKFTTRTVFQHVVRDLLDADDWRATKAAWDVVESWNDWLGEIGAQDREPERAELDLDVDARTTEVSYTVIREEPSLPTDERGGVDYDDLGFTKGPTSVDVAAVEDLEDSDHE